MCKRTNINNATLIIQNKMKKQILIVSLFVIKYELLFIVDVS